MRRNMYAAGWYYRLLPLLVSQQWHTHLRFPLCMKRLFKECLVCLALTVLASIAAPEGFIRLGDTLCCSCLRVRVWMKLDIEKEITFKYISIYSAVKPQVSTWVWNSWTERSLVEVGLEPWHLLNVFSTLNGKKHHCSHANVIIRHTTWCRKCLFCMYLWYKGECHVMFHLCLMGSSHQYCLLFL